MKVLALICLLSTPGLVLAQEIAIRAGHLVDPATGTVASNQLILVKDRTIVSVGPEGQIPPGAQVIDLSQAWVMPGLMDCHTHLTFGNPPGVESTASYLLSRRRVATKPTTAALENGGLALGLTEQWIGALAADAHLAETLMSPLERPSCRCDGSSALSATN